jgi:4a-hydroxytetrahydrobiopterin dehydratase
LTDLTKQKCEACTIDAPLVDKKRFTELLKDLDGWEIIYEDINILSKTYSFDNYEDSVKFATDIVKLAEDEDHHPSILLEWGSVRVQWWSHKIKGLHMNDFICAAKTEALIN